jgi:hypothetical protein
MKKLKLTRAWSMGSGLLQPGEYAIPAQVSMTVARCARADGAGTIVTTPPARKPPRAAKSEPVSERAPAGEADDLPNSGNLLV